MSPRLTRRSVTNAVDKLTVELMEFHSFVRGRIPILDKHYAPKTIAGCEETFSLTPFTKVN